MVTYISTIKHQVPQARGVCCCLLQIYIKALRVCASLQWEANPVPSLVTTACGPPSIQLLLGPWAAKELW